MYCIVNLRALLRRGELCKKELLEMMTDEEGDQGKTFTLADFPLAPYF